MKNRILVLIVTSLLSSYANSTTIHADDWASGSSSSYVTVFGNLDVAANPDATNGNSLKFNTLGNTTAFYYDQIQYNMGSAGTIYDSFKVSFDLYIENLIGTGNQFTVLFDTPTVRNVTFTNAGSVDILPGWAPTVSAASFAEDQALRFEMLFNIAANEWDITLNDSLIYSGFIDNVENGFLQPAEYLRSVRFSLGTRSSLDGPDTSTNIYLDNVHISAVPVPAAALLFGSALIGLVGLRRKQSA